ncbi:MAG: hypothetical protein ABWX92_10310 [Mycetocola sp.]
MTSLALLDGGRHAPQATALVTASLGSAVPSMSELDDSLTLIGARQDRSHSVQ